MPGRQPTLNLSGQELCDDCGRPPGYLAGPTADLPATATCGRPVYGTCDPPRVLGYAVACEDGETRHAGLFACRIDATKWAEWGHACTTRHEIRRMVAA